MPAILPAVKAAVVAIQAWMANTVTVIGIKIAYGTIVKAAIIVSAAAYSRAQAKKALRGYSSLTGRNVTVRDPVAPRQLIYGQARVGGIIVFAASSGTNNEYLHLVVAMAGHEVEKIGAVYFNDELALAETDTGSAATGRFAGYADIWKKLGGTGQTVEINLQNAVGSGVWSNDHRLDGIAYMHIRLKNNPDVFSTGIPNITAVVKGKKVYDPRTTTTYWTANSALCLRDFLTDSAYGLGMSAGEIDDTEVTAAANICDEDVALDAGGTEDRYKTNGVVLSSETAAEIIDRLAGAMAGSVFYVGGKWIMRAGAHQTPTLTFTEDDLRGSIEIQTKDSRRDTCNRVRGTYVSATNNWQPADFPPVVNATYKSEDGNEDLWRDIVLPFTTSDTAAQRIAKIELERARQDITVVFPAKLTALSAQCGDVIQLTLARYGWSAKQFEVIESSIVFSPEGEIGVDLTLRETAAGVWDWSSEETTVDLAPNTTLPDPYTVPAPSGVTLTSGATVAIRQTDGTVLNRLKVAWTAPARSFITNGGNVWIEYKKNADSDWITWANDIRGDQTADYILDVKAGTAYDVRVRFENVWGVRGNYTTVTNHIVTAAGLTPTDPTAATKSAQGTYTAGDGSVYSYLTFTVPALPANAAKQFLMYKRNGDTDWLVAAGPLTNTADATVTINDLSPGVIYAVATLALSSLDVVSSYVDATSSPFTAPNKTSGPSAPTNVTRVSGASAGKGPVVNSGAEYFTAVVTWDKVTDKDLAYYEWVLTTPNNTDAAADAIIAGGGGFRTTELFARAALGTPAIGYFRVRSVNTSGAASAWVAAGDLLAYYAQQLGGAATLGVGTTAGTVAAGNDSRITGAAQKSSNLSDLANTGTALSNLGGAAKSANLSDLNNTATALINLGVRSDQFVADTGSGGGGATFTYTFNHNFGFDFEKVIAACTTDDKVVVALDYNASGNNTNNSVFILRRIDGATFNNNEQYRVAAVFLK